MLGASSAAMCLLLTVTATISLPETSSAVTPKSHMRVKRCSCNNWMDKECIYFCHLDIIWVNTGSQMLPYGLGSPGKRRKRTSVRCQCKDVKDMTCNSFCQNTEWAIADSKPRSNKEMGAVKNFLNKKSLVWRSLRHVAAQVVFAKKRLITSSELPSDSTVRKRKR